MIAVFATGHADLFDQVSMRVLSRLQLDNRGKIRLRGSEVEVHMISRRLARRTAAAMQERRDLVAAEIWNKINDGGAVPRFGLYLRSFFTGNKLAVIPEVPLKPIYLFDEEKIVAPAMTVNTDHLDYESIFVDALGEECPLIAVREASEDPRGAGRVRLHPQRWQQQIASLVAHPAIIICFPLETEGTTWEFDHLLSVGALDRTAILMPEDPLLIPRNLSLIHI